MRVLQCKSLPSGKLSVSCVGIGECQVELTFTVDELQEFIDWKNKQGSAVIASDPKAIEETDTPVDSKED